MIAQETLDHWFNYHPPTPETSPKYAAILQAQNSCQNLIHEALESYVPGGALQPLFTEITGACHGFAQVINTMAPDSADKTASIQCVRIARMAANETLLLISKVSGTGSEEDFKVASRATELAAIAEAELLKARWQANSAIACDGK